jgi:predicted RNA-binding protein with PIN domain
MQIIIDGYNLLRSIEHLFEDQTAVSDVKLCHAIDKYLKYTRQKGEIVFDGIGPPDKSTFNTLENIQIIFTGSNTDADTIIESKIKNSTAPTNLIVVSNDRRIRDAASARKAAATKSEDFWNDVVKFLEKKRSAPEPRGKRHGLTDGETSQWLKLFGLDKEQQ